MKPIHIGIDFDNTLIDYHSLFYTYALKKNLITPQKVKTKEFIKKIMSQQSPKGNYDWTRLQGLIYGRYILEAKLAKGFSYFSKQCRENEIKVSIISHKTLYPIVGKRINLRKMANLFIQKQNVLQEIFNAKNIHFVQTLEEKLNLIRRLKCTHYIDDLEDVLTHRKFPQNVIKILYHPNEKEITTKSLTNFRSWYAISKYFF